jgi:NADPH:quinone reductase-like Zn-dependent oxidoreductase
MGICGIQFAKLAGLTVITTASPSNAEYLRGLGADFVIDYHSPTLVEDIRSVISRDLELAWDCRPSEDSAALCAELLSANGNAKYNTLLGYTADIVKKLNPAVETSATWGYTAFGEPWFWEEEEPAVPEDFELAKQMVKISPELLAQGKLKPPRIYLDRGGSGLEGVLQGIDELRNNRVSGGKLVYTM